MHQPASRFNVTATFLGYHWFWLPASYASSSFFAADVHGTHATATFSKRRLLLLLLLILITGVNAGANEMHQPASCGVSDVLQVFTEPMLQLHVWATTGSGYQPYTHNIYKIYRQHSNTHTIYIDNMHTMYTYS